VVTCFIECGGRILLLKRSQRVGTFKGKWAGVSGFVESTPDEQGLVEIEEETGLKPGDVVMVKRGEALELEDAANGVAWVIHPYLYRTAAGEGITIDWEHDEWRWIDPGDMENFDTVPDCVMPLSGSITSG
jgi:ADP-ribose pyrophosphatase YjhB (NUDIX family)